MVARGCRIGISLVALMSLLVAIALSIAAAATPAWQVAYLDQVNQVRYVGLYQTCAYGSRQGPGGFPQWLCTFIPYGQGHLRNQFNLINGHLESMQPAMVPGSSEVDYVGYGGESWRFSTLILLVIAAIFGFLSFVFELGEICLDATRTFRCLKAMSGLSLVTLFFGALSCIAGILTFAIESQENQNMYVMELTAFSVFQWGQSFYLAIFAAIMFLIAFGIDVGGAALICVTANREKHRQRFFFVERSHENANNKNKKKNQNKNKNKNKNATVQDPDAVQPMIEQPNHHEESGMVRDQSFHNYNAEPMTWKYPKITWV